MKTRLSDITPVDGNFTLSHRPTSLPWHIIYYLLYLFTYFVFISKKLYENPSTSDKKIYTMALSMGGIVDDPKQLDTSFTLKILENSTTDFSLSLLRIFLLSEKR